MPARLKSFELHGYKTFASRIEFQFSEGITAIVGPNGSGKSNISDALRWVLGEQSYGLLRGKKTEDMIFSGSETRPRAGMASATVIFDNSDGWLPIDFSEVGITRRAYRDGENEYLLNGQRVRLKDVSEVLAKSGLAERTYTIIGQGLVDAALALKAEERRRLFEEAAGIGLHRTRREEAIKRLETTRRNLERVHDILAELQPRLRSLERQAKRAQEYNQLKNDLQVVLREWYGYHWHKAQAELVNAQAEAKSQEEKFSTVQTEQLNLDLKLTTSRGLINDIRNKLTALHAELTEFHQQRETLSRQQAVNNERVRSLKEQLSGLGAEKTRLEEEIAAQEDKIASTQQEVEQYLLEREEAHQSVLESQEKLVGRQRERSLLEKETRTLRDQLTNHNARITQLRVRQTEKETHLKKLQESVSRIEQELQSNDLELADMRRVRSGLTTRQEEQQQKFAEINQDLEKVRVRLKSFEVDKKKISAELAQKKTSIAQLQAEINVLDDAENNLVGYQEGARILLKAAKENRVAGAYGALGTFLQVPEEYELAITAVMGEFIDSLVTATTSQADQALDLLESDTTRGSVFPVDTIHGRSPITLELEEAPVAAEKILGVASRLIQAEAQVSSIIESLFGRVIVVKDRATARKILASRDWSNIQGFKIVTLAGEVYIDNGPIIRGASGKGLLVRPRQKREHRKNLAEATAAAGDLESQLLRLDEKAASLAMNEREINQAGKVAEQLITQTGDDIHQHELKMEKLQRSIQWQNEQLQRAKDEISSELQALQGMKFEIGNLTEVTERIKNEMDSKVSELNNLPLDELVEQNKYWVTNEAVIERALLDARSRLAEKNTNFTQMGNRSASMKTRYTQFEAEIDLLMKTKENSSAEELRIREKIEELIRIVDPIEEQLKTREAEYNQLSLSDAEARQVLRAAEQRLTEAKIHLAHHQESFTSLGRHIEDDFGLVTFDYTETITGAKPLPIDGMVEELPKVATLSPELEETIRQQKAQIRRMGAINPEAQIEYQEVRDRFEFLTSQVEDLEKAEKDIREVITELDLLMEREFRRTFDSVAEEFKEIFTRLFGGGSARLALTEPDNLTETGIDIEARLPGRREQGLSLLSGGERSLTATALVFALLRVSPTPFCILDEVDAMLDEANVGRFRDLLSELSEKTQFIVITHNRNTVQAASIIYGVTMGRDSASQVISLRMDELGEEFGV